MPKLCRILLCLLIHLRNPFYIARSICAMKNKCARANGTVLAPRGTMFSTELDRSKMRAIFFLNGIWKIIEWSTCGFFSSRNPMKKIFVYQFVINNRKKSFWSRFKFSSNSGDPFQKLWPNYDLQVRNNLERYKISKSNWTRIEIWIFPIKNKQIFKIIAL